MEPQGLSLGLNTPLQVGHVLDFRPHDVRQLGWYVWLQTVVIIGVVDDSSSIQIIHCIWSADIL